MYNNYRVNAIVQARTTSSRLPNKVLLPLAGKEVLRHIIERLRRSKYIDNVIIACTTNEADNPIIELCEKLDCKYYRGSEDDVLTRVLEAAKAFDTDIIVEVTADCPCVDPELADAIIVGLIKNNADYCSNVIKRSMPRGLDVQAFSVTTLDRVNMEVDNDIDRQHVSTWMYRNPNTRNKYKVNNCFFGSYDLSDCRLTLDTKEDYDVLQRVFNLYNDNYFTYNDLCYLFGANTNIFDANSHIEQKSYEKELEQWYKENTKSLL